MAVATKKKQDAAEVAKLVIEWLKKNEMKLFEEGCSVPDARKRFIKESGKKITANQFSDVRKDACRFWKRQSCDLSIQRARLPKWSGLR